MAEKNARRDRDDAEKTPLDLAREFSFTVWSYKKGEMVSLMIHLGDRLGIYRSLQGAGPVTAAELAERTGLKERWLLEWLRGQAAAQLIDYKGEDRFELNEIQAQVLADEEESIFFAGGAFGEPTRPDVVAGLAEAFETGLGLSYDQLGPTCAHRTERMLGPWTRMALVPEILPALDGVVAKLTQGAKAVDVGCGAGVALIAMAEAFPATEFHGYDPSLHAIERARETASKRGVENVVLEQAGGEDLPQDSSFDFVITFDCIHDMTRPDKVIGKIRGALHGDGTWLIKDIRSKPTFEENLRNPMLALLYGFSVSSCMSSALSTEDGMGLGTLGFNPEVAERMTREAGFTRFQMHDFDDPSNLYYEVRP
ncbi:MAG: methyltransferase domain-containing protein [Acidobacteriota bacterium]